MKKIPRHTIDAESIEWIYDDNKEELKTDIEDAKANSKLVSLVAERALEYFFNATGLNKTADYSYFLSIAYRSIRSLIRLKLFHNEEITVDIDGNGPVLLKGEEKEKDIVDDEWLNAYFLSLISRNEVNWLLEISKDKVKNPNPTTNFRASYNYLLFQYLHSEDTEFKKQLFEQADELVRGYSDVIKPEPHPQGYFYLFLRRHWLWVARAIEQKSQDDFSSYLAKALEEHQQFYSQKKGIDKGAPPLCDIPKGFISLPLTAFCARAFDKGMKIEIESDYIPKYLYEGTVLKK